MVVIAAGESGGLFSSGDGGATWSHIDSLPAFRMSDVLFAGLYHPQIVIATATDANPNAQANLGGVWASSNSGATWTHVVLPALCAPGATNGYGITYVAVDTIYVATDCGLVVNASLGAANWAQSANWRLLRQGGLMSVSAQGSTTGAIVIDVCLQGGGADRSVDSGRTGTWRGVTSGSECASPHSIAQAPGHPNIVFATSHATDPGGGDVLESDDGGLSWPVVKSGSYSGRPLYVATNYPVDQVIDHFDVYWAGQQATCSYVVTGTGLHCPSDPAKWNLIPTGSLNHDINAIAVNPIPFTNNCMIYMAADFGVYKMGTPTAAQPCGDPAAWTIAGNAGAGFGALQIYQLTGQVQFPITGDGVNISGHTSLFFGTQDANLWATYDAGASRWQCFGGAGGCDPEGAFLQVAATPQLSSQITLDSLDGSVMEKAVLNQTTGALSDEAPWTAVTPPGNNSPPFFVSPNVYVEWSGGTLYLTQYNGASWVRGGVLPAGIALPPDYGVSGTSLTENGPGGSPAVYAVINDANGNQGIAILSSFLPPPASPPQFQIQTVGGKNSSGGASGLQAVWGYWFGQGAWFPTPAFAVDPNDFRHLLAADAVQKAVMVSFNAGQTWTPDTGLTGMITAGGASMKDSLGYSQVHAFAFDPANSTHILVGTDQAGIFASANGGATWTALPETGHATAITSFFFDDRTNAIYVGTYGRGLWKLTVDWTSLR